MNGELVVLADAAALAAEGARRVAAAAARVLAERDRFRLVLSGGSTPRALYERLTTGDSGTSVDWPRVELYFGDERCVPPDDPASNYRMVRESLLDRLARPPAAVHRIEGELSPAAAAERYEQRIAGPPGSGVPRFDLVLLGLGDDGHTASLFPGTPALDERQRLVAPARAPSAPRDRVTMTFPVLQAASEILFLVSGESKAAALARVLGGVANGEANAEVPLPAARVVPTSGRLVWLVDEAATASLKGRCS